MSESIQVVSKAPLTNKEAQFQKKQKTELRQSMDSPAEKILFLQRTIGNQAIGRLMKSGALAAFAGEGEKERLQRFADCGTSDHCPARESGEAAQARTGTMGIGEASNGVQGILISNFDIGSPRIKNSLTSDPLWAQFWGQMVTQTNRRWRIKGFSDCQGSEDRNLLLRWERAIAINNLLPRYARMQVDRFEAAPLTDCMAENSSIANRALNRSVLIELVSERFDFPPETVTARLRPEACFNGTTIYVNKNGRSESCPAFSGNIGDPIPPGRFCIRRQGEAQRRGGLAGMMQDRASWYLLEPQFSTGRFKMQLHPGTFSSGCITLTDRACFDRLAAILNSPGTVSGFGYDGYPPGNTAGEGGTEIVNPRQTVDCAGWLIVTTSAQGCTP